MASSKLREAMAPPAEDLKPDISSMIDLVFLLLIFFMVSSHMIVVQIDKNVKVPVADTGEVQTNAQGRILINVDLNEDTGEVIIKGPTASMVFNTSEQITEYVDKEREKMVESRQSPIRLHLRADREVPTKYIKKVVTAAAAAQVNDVIFDTFKVNF